MEALQSQLTNLRAQLDAAETQNEAFNIAFAAAELCISALGQAPNKKSRSEIESAASSLLKEAESIKSDRNWQPSPQATAITNGVNNLSISPASVIQSPRSIPRSSAPTPKKLKEPKATRLIPTSEKILLLKASTLNNFKYPPWDKTPEDIEFELTSDGSPFTDLPDLELSEEQRGLFERWARAGEALPPPTWRQSNEASPLEVQLSGSVDLVQDAASDCSVVASLCAAAARAERGHEMIISCLVWPRSPDLKRPVISPNGKYVLKLNFNGCWRKVIIDDRLPVSKNTRLLHVVDRRNPSLLWPPLVEKAYLKVRGGYDFPGSSSCSDLWAFTGWIPEQIFLQSGDIAPGQLWKRIFQAFEYGDVLVTVGTGQLDRRSEKHYGLVSQHNYAVISMRETGEGKFFLIKNPWLVGTQWKPEDDSPSTVSAPIDSSTVSTRNLALGTSDVVEVLPAGSKWINFDKVMERFTSIFLNWNPGLFTFRQDIHFPWEIEASSASTNLIRNNPQFSLAVETSGVVWLLLCRHFRDDLPGSHQTSDTFNDGSVRRYDPEDPSAESPKGYMGLNVYANNGERVYLDEGVIERTPFVNTPQALLRLDVNGASKYTIVISQQELPSSYYTFTLTAFSDVVTDLGRAAEAHEFQTEIYGSWTNGNAGGGQTSARYYENPQFRLTLPERTSLTALLESPYRHVPMHIAIVHGRGERVYQLRGLDTIAQSESYLPGLVMAKATDLDAGTYTIICSTFEVGQLADFALRVNSNCKCELKKIPKEGAGTFQMKLQQICFGTQNLRMATNIFPRRLVNINVVARYIKARYRPGAAPEDAGGRSPCRVSIEIGRGPDRIVVVSTNEGDYSDDHTLRTPPVDISPNLLSRGDLWLVMERMAAPNPGFEELYDVEMNMDVPNGVAIGPWRGWDD